MAHRRAALYRPLASAARALGSTRAIVCEPLPRSELCSRALSLDSSASWRASRAALGGGTLTVASESRTSLDRLAASESTRVLVLLVRRRICCDAAALVTLLGRAIPVFNKIQRTILATVCQLRSSTLSLVARSRGAIASSLHLGPPIECSCVL